MRTEFNIHLIRNVSVLVAGINVSVGSSLGGSINQQGVVAPNVALDPNTNNVIGATNQPNLQSQSSAVNAIHQTIVTAANTALTSTASTFAPLASHTTSNSDINSNVSIARNRR